MSIIYLVKESNDLVCHCECPEGLIGYPGQMDCPWCGCGWLFSCMDCAKAFTFAKGVELDTTWEALGERYIRNMWEEEPKADDVATWVESMQALLADVEVGETYVYFDGFVVPADAAGFEFEGWFAEHNMDEIPQVAALEDPSIIDSVLANEDYWRERALLEEV